MSGSDRPFNPKTLHAVCSSPEPMQWPVMEFCSDAAQPGFECFYNARVMDVDCFHKPGGITHVSHEYLICRILGACGAGSPDIWARCERNPGGYDGGPFRLISGVGPNAKDTVSLSYSRQHLKLPDDKLIFSSAFTNLNVFHILDLLKIIHNTSPRYGLGSHNCWWYCAVSSSALQIFGRDWSHRPDDHWTKKAIRHVGKDTKVASLGIRQQFKDNWPNTAPMISFKSKSAWGYESDQSKPSSILLAGDTSDTSFTSSPRSHTSSLPAEAQIGQDSSASEPEAHNAAIAEVARDHPETEAPLRASLEDPCRQDTTSSTSTVRPPTNTNDRYQYRQSTVPPAAAQSDPGLPRRQVTTPFPVPVHYQTAPGNSLPRHHRDDTIRGNRQMQNTTITMPRAEFEAPGERPVRYPHPTEYPIYTDQITKSPTSVISPPWPGNSEHAGSETQSDGSLGEDRHQQSYPYPVQEQHVCDDEQSQTHRQRERRRRFPQGPQDQQQRPPLYTAASPPRRGHVGPISFPEPYHGAPTMSAMGDVPVDASRLPFINMRLTPGMMSGIRVDGATEEYRKR